MGPLGLSNEQECFCPRERSLRNQRGWMDREGAEYNDGVEARIAAQETEEIGLGSREKRPSKAQNDLANQRRVVVILP